MVERHADQVLIDGLVFPEGLRWHDDRLWFCDIETHEVITADATGRVLDRLVIPGEHGIGLAWTPSGELVVSGRFEKLMAVRDGAVVVLHDLHADGSDAWSNDIVIDDAGRTYVASFGLAYDLEDHAGNAARLQGAGRIVLVDVDGTTRTVAEGLSMPNTMQLADHGKTLLCSDSLAHRLVSYPVADDGSLGPVEVVAEFPSMPDGSTLDAEGGLWVALPHESEVRRLVGGAVTDVVLVDEEVFDVTLGGPEGRTLYAAVSNLAATTPPEPGAERARPGRIVALDVDVPGVR